MLASRAFNVIFVLLFAFLADAVYVDSPPVLAADSGPAPASTAADAMAPGDELASVNGVPIKRQDFDRAHARSVAHTRAAHSYTFALDLLHGLIEQELIVQFAAGLQLDVEAEVDREFERLQDDTTRSAWQVFLAANQFTEAEFRLALRDQFLTGAVRKHVTSHLEGEVAHAHARHILVRGEVEAQGVMNRLLAGESFAALAAELSLDGSTRDHGGDLGWFIRGELLDRNLNEAAFTLAIGEISGPQPTRLGYHIMQVMARAPRRIEPGRLPHLTESIFRLWLDEQVENAEIILNLAALDQLSAANP